MASMATYEENVQLHIRKWRNVASQEGTTNCNLLSRQRMPLEPKQASVVHLVGPPSWGRPRQWIPSKHSKDNGYHPNTAKTWTIVKEDKYDATIVASDVNIIKKGKRQLGSTLGRSLVNL